MIASFVAEGAPAEKIVHRLTLPIACLAISVLPPLILGACTHRSSPARNVLLITVDTLRADHVTSYGYPRRTTPELADLFEEGAIFERAYSTSSYTTASIVSLLAGLLPQEHRVRLFDQVLPKDTVLVTEMLPDTYEKAAFVSNGVLSRGGLEITERFDHFDDTMERRPDTHNLERSAGATTDAAIEWMRARRDPARPLFLWVHYMDPHRPYVPPETWAAKFDRGANDGSAPVVVGLPNEGAEHEKAVLYFDRYDGEIAYTDAEIGRLVRAYDEAMGLQTTLVVFTSDHGETLAERPVRFQHTYHVYEELVRVPLMIRGPGVPTARVRRLVSGIDVLPTILAHVGVNGPPGLAGSDLRRPQGLDPDRVVFAESIHTFTGAQWRAAISNDRKWVVQVRPDPVRIEKRIFFDLIRDSAETRPRPWPGGNGPGKRLEALVDSDPDPAAKPANPERGTLSERNREALRALGYLQ